MFVDVADPLSREQRFLDYLKEHGIEPTHTYAVKIGRWFIRAHQHHMDLSGNRYLFNGDVARTVRWFRKRRDFDV